MKGNYNNIAPFYDTLSRFVYGNAILEAQVFLVNAIPANSSVLIIGGGTGHILETIAKKHNSGLRITYVDISEKMIRLSKKKNAGNNEVFFMTRSICDVTFNQPFDVVITPFFLDNFGNDTAKIVFDKINATLKAGGLWLFADFCVKDKSNLWQKWLLKLMYLFFKIVCGIEASNLPDTDSLFKRNKYELVLEKTFYSAFIYAVIYQKIPETKLSIIFNL